jgi:hypothetical protein
MMTHEGHSYELTGKDAKRALLSYIEWVQSFNRSTWRPEEQAAVDKERANIQYHVDEVMKIIDDPDLTVCIV